MRYWLAGFVFVLLLGSGNAHGQSYIDSGASVQYIVGENDLPSEAVGKALAQALSGKAPASVSGSLGQLPPAGWPLVALHKHPSSKAGQMPIAARGKRKCKCKTELGDVRKRRFSALFASANFQVGKTQPEVLELAVSYHDGMAVYLNGQEVVRRNLPRDIAGARPARRIRGPERETFFIAVPPGLLRRGENHLAFELRPSGHRLAPSLDFSLRGADKVRIVRGPLVQRMTEKQAVILFETDRPSRGTVRYSSGEKRAQVATSGGGLARRHRAVLEVEPGKPLRYQASVPGVEGTEFKVAPAPRVGDVIRFAVYGDMRGGHRKHGQIIQSILDEAPDFVVVTGDLVLRGSDGADWQRFFSVAANLLARVVYYPVAGNHDTGKSGDEERRMGELFEPPPGPANRPLWGHWYGMRIADIHFVMLDSNSYRHKIQLEWLDEELTRARAEGARFIFAAVHDGPFSRGIHRGNRYAVENYLPILTKHKVSLLFSGHDHLYQRGKAKGLNYVVSGGGGAPLYPIKCGVKGRPKCKQRDGMIFGESAYHYVMVSVHKKHIELCAKRPDKSPLEPCVRIRR